MPDKTNDVDISTLPDLPGLEEVKPQLVQRTFVYLLMIIPSGGICLFLYWLASRLWSYVDYNSRILLIAGLGVMILSVIFIMLRILLSYSAYGTSSEGIIAYALLRKKVIAWDDVIRADHQENSMTGSETNIETRHGILKIKMLDPLSHFFDTLALTASIWQHMRKLGKANDDLLMDGQLSLWKPIPDTVPVNIDCECKISDLYNLIALYAFLLFLCVLLITIVGFKISIIPVTLVFLFGVLVYVNNRHISRYLIVNAENIIAHKLFRKTEISWSEITGCGQSGKIIWIKARNPDREIWIPCDTSDISLASIRNLRERFPSVLFPNMLYFESNKQKDNRISAGSFRLNLYISSQSPDVARKLTKASNHLDAIPLIALLCGVLELFLDPLGRLYSFIHSEPGSLFYGTQLTQLTMAFVFIPAGILAAAIVKRINNRIVVSCQKEWNGYLQLRQYPFSIITCRLLITAAVISLIGLVLSVDNYYRITVDSIAVNSFFSFKEHRYPLSQISSISKHTPDYRKADKSYWIYEIRFSDGNKLSISDGLMFSNDREKLNNAMQLISQKSHIPVNYQ